MDINELIAIVKKKLTSQINIKQINIDTLQSIKGHKKNNLFVVFFVQKTMKAKIVNNEKH